MQQRPEVTSRNGIRWVGEEAVQLRQFSLATLTPARLKSAQKVLRQVRAKRREKANG